MITKTHFDAHLQRSGLTHAPIGVLGSSGQLGRSLSSLLGSRCQSFDRTQVDLAKPAELIRLLDGLNISALVNAAAYTQVDQAERDTPTAHMVNSESVGLMAQWCAKRDIPFVHFSTDYVFPGTGDTPLRETDPTGPLNVYGKTKLDGEKAVAQAGGRSLVLRTSWVYSEHGKNFLLTMLRLGKEKVLLSVVADQYSAPTYAADLAEGAISSLLSALNQPVFPSGIYHFSAQGFTTWAEFAEAIFEEAYNHGIPLRVQEVKRINTSDYPSPARRPLNTRLNTQKAATQLQYTLPHWRDGLSRCVSKLAAPQR